MPLQLLLPVAVRIQLIDKHSAMLSTVTVQITLCITIDIEPSNQAPSPHSLLPHGHIDSPTAPCDLMGLTHVD